jgi:hypothetical protein
MVDRWTHKTFLESIHTSRLPITELFAMIPTRGRLTKWTALLSEALGERQCFGERAADLLITDVGT